MFITSRIEESLRIHILTMFSVSVITFARTLNTALMWFSCGRMFLRIDMRVRRAVLLHVMPCRMRYNKPTVW